MTELFPFLIFIAVLLLGPVIGYVKHIGHVERVTNEISAKGFLPVSIQRRWLDFDQNTATYEVVYEDQLGNRQKTSCKVRSIFLFFEGDLYWTQPLVGGNMQSYSVPSTAGSYDAIGPSSTPAADASAAHKIQIDLLRKENAKLKAKVTELEEVNAFLRSKR